MHENRETSKAPAVQTYSRSAGEGLGRTARMYASEEVDGVLAPGQFLMWGSIGRLMTTLFLSASGFAILRGRFMPAWLGRLAWITALINFAFVPAMFFGPDAAQFYSAVGWGTTATAPVLVVIWILIASIIMVRTPTKPTAAIH